MSRGRVLLLEDDPALRGLLEEALTSEDLDVRVCDSFATLRDAAEARGGELVVADFWGGAQRELDDAARQQIRGLGVRALIRKPFDLEELLQTVEDALGQRG